MQATAVRFAPQARPYPGRTLPLATHYQKGDPIEFVSISPAALRGQGGEPMLAAIRDIEKQAFGSVAALSDEFWGLLVGDRDKGGFLVDQLTPDLMGTRIAVAMSNGGALGFVMTCLDLNALIEEQREGRCVGLIGVLPQFQGHHLGEGLLLEGLAQEHQRGTDQVDLTVNAAKHGARALYQKVGFDLIRSMGDKYEAGYVAAAPDCREALLMQLHGLNNGATIEHLESLRNSLPYPMRRY